MKVLTKELSPERIESIVKFAKDWRDGGGYSVPIKYQGLWNEWRLTEGLGEVIKVGSPVHLQLKAERRGQRCGTLILEREREIKASIAAGAPVDYVASLVRENKHW